MSKNYEKLREDINAMYAREHVALGYDGTMEHLERGREWNLSSTLNQGGVLIFPHAGVADCGYQIAACVHACLDSGADKVLVVSVLHSFTAEMEEARVRVANGESPSQFRHWGIQGAGIPGERQEWQYDHVLISWRHFWRAETTRRGIRGPKVIERYPYLAGGKPGELPGVDEVARLAEDAVIVSTADPFHHGIGYGDAPEDSLMPLDGGLERAQASIEEGIELLSQGDYWGYNGQCVRAKSDARDAGQLFRYLRGDMEGRILDISYSDASALYEQPAPTWVAGALIEWELSS